MYKVVVNTQSNPTTVWDYRNSDNLLRSGTIEKSVDQMDELKIELIYNEIDFKAFLSLVEVTDVVNNKVEFRGRVLFDTDRMGEDGVMATEVTCEAAMAYMHDTYPSNDMFTDYTPQQRLSKLIELHNARCEDYKKIKVGNLTVTPKVPESSTEEYDDTAYFITSPEKSIMQHILDDIVGVYGGEIVMRYEADGNYIDWVNKIGSDKSTVIKIAKNLKSISKHIDATEVITRLIPLGTSEPTAWGGSKRLEIVEDSRSGGKNYIDIPELIALYGIQTGHVVFEDAYAPDTLYDKGIKERDEIKKKYAKKIVEIGLLDLSTIGVDPDVIDRGNTYPVEAIGVNERVRVEGVTIDITMPHSKSVRIGEEQLGIVDVADNNTVNIANTIVQDAVPVIIDKQVPGIIDTQVPEIITATVPDLINGKITDFKDQSLGQIIENTIDVNKNEIYDSVVNKINNSTDVIKAQALQVDAAMINEIVSSDILTNRLVADSAFITNLMASNIVSDKIKTTDIDLNRATVTGGSGDNKLILTADEIKQSGTYVGYDGNTNVTRKLYTQLKNGYVRIRNDTDVRSLYMVDYGLTTALTGDPSGTIQFFYKRGGTGYAGIQLMSYMGPLDLQTMGQIGIFGDSGVNINGSGNVSMSSMNKTTVSGSDLVLDGWSSTSSTTPIQTDLQDRKGSGNCYVRTSGELRVTNLDGYNGGSITYKDLRCQNIYGLGTVNYGTLKALSSEKYKDNIEKWKIDASDKIRSTELYSYNYKRDLESGDTRKRHGVIIERETPEHVIIDDGIDMNEITFTLYKALKEQIIRNDKLEERLNKLEESA